MPTTTLSQSDTGQFFASRSKLMAGLGKDGDDWGDYWIDQYYDTSIGNTEYNARRSAYLTLEDKADNGLLVGTTQGGSPQTFAIDADPSHPLPPIRH